MIGVTDNLSIVKDLLAEAATDAKRGPASVRLLAVSKKQPLAKVFEAAAAGQRDFGENQVQEALPKIRAAEAENLIWHFIGHLQTNKTRQVAEHFDWVHSIDRLRIAERLNEHRPAGMPPLNVCLQVNLDDESSKSGLSPVDVQPLAALVHELPNLHLRGLMCLPAIRDGFEEQRKPFRILAELKEFISTTGIELDTLSMGMSDDFRAAIFEGATIVRIGTRLFGQRS
ncbi:MAG TPA: YggS family pyridoxal phosphate-dependent enzyme [Woeseiaceae bacterium]|nr:YggS family pyridoxal phosphate-dependent enzyme [Woeseiaceae bacterium]